MGDGLLHTYDSEDGGATSLCKRVLASCALTAYRTKTRAVYCNNTLRSDVVVKRYFGEGWIAAWQQEVKALAKCIGHANMCQLVAAACLYNDDSHAAASLSSTVDTTAGADCHDKRDGGPNTGVLLVRKVQGQDLYEAFIRDGSLTTPKQFMQVALQLVGALGWLHNRNMIHGDVKAENVIVTLHEPGGVLTVTLIDYEMAAVLRHPNKLNDMRVPTGTRGLVGPEVSSDMRRGYGFHTDVYALGCLFMELTTPWLWSPQHEWFMDTPPPRLQPLLRAMMDADWRARPTMRECEQRLMAMQLEDVAQSSATD